MQRLQNPAGRVAPALALFSCMRLLDRSPHPLGCVFLDTALTPSAAYSSPLPPAVPSSYLPAWILGQLRQRAAMLLRVLRHLLALLAPELPACHLERSQQTGDRDRDRETGHPGG